MGWQQGNCSLFPGEAQEGTQAWTQASPFSLVTNGHSSLQLESGSEKYRKDTLQINNGDNGGGGGGDDDGGSDDDGGDDDDGGGDDNGGDDDGGDDDGGGGDDDDDGDDGGDGDDGDGGGDDDGGGGGDGGSGDGDGGDDDDGGGGGEGGGGGGDDDDDDGGGGDGDAFSGLASARLGELYFTALAAKAPADERTEIVTANEAISRVSNLKAKVPIVTEDTSIHIYFVWIKSLRDEEKD
ncbi:hypothetical protein U0070_001599 [Myodes glareolus]|uniref:Uncharacterized protein n=1 Tax=Myodes glareolus TaxID=447135 RepID=A0AAW0IX36_MYOGA